jgi:hypothetical protein
MKSGGLIVLVALLSGIVAEGARASIGPIQVVQADSAFDSTDWKQVVVNCPPGTIAFSGGVGLSVGTQTQLPLIVHQSLPQGNPPTGWLGLAQEREPTATFWGITSVALCATVSGYELVESSSPFDGASPKTVFANCPPGKTPIGGGGGIFFFAPELALHRLSSTETGWHATAIAHAAVGNWLLNVKVSCAPAVDVERFAGRTLNETDVVDILELTCPTNRVAIAGGGTGPNRIAIFTTWPVLGGWEVAARKIIPVSNWVLAAEVLCLRPTLFADGFESGDTGGWSSTVP